MLEWLKELHSAEGIANIIGWGGLVALTMIIFAETGLLVGFFLPGDSLLITAGVLANPQNPHHVPALEIWTMNAILIVAAITGDQLNFYIGRRVGNAIWDRPDGRLYKRRYVEEAHEFYEKWGGLAVVAARFVPILRTFVPFVAGVAKMEYKKFVFWNVFGGFFWITSLLWIGFFLGQTTLAKSLDRIIVLVIFVSFLPIAIGATNRWLKSRRAAAAAT